MFKNMNRAAFALLLTTAPILVALFCIGIGRFSLTFTESLNVLLRALFFDGAGVDGQSYSVVVNIRLPRILLAMLCGGGLAVAGAGLQAMFSNPMVAPDTLGVSSGAGFGAALALLFDAGLFAVQVSATVFGLAAMGIAVFIGRSRGKSPLIMMVLSGLVIAAMFQAFVSLIKYVADTEEQLPAITYWLMGSLTNAGYKSLRIGAPAILLGCLTLFLLRWKINVLSLGEDESRSLGVNPVKFRGLVVLASAAITAACVSMCGQVGWIGLLIPHTSRMLFGSDNNRVIPASISLGAVFMLLIDTVARSATAAEIPVSILSSTLGAPFFILLLKKTGGSWT